MELQLDDFALVNTSDGHYYFQFCDPTFEVCLEPCLNGFDIGVYLMTDKDEPYRSSVLDKECTNFKGTYTEETAFSKALEIANRLYIKAQIVYDQKEKSQETQPLRG